MNTTQILFKICFLLLPCVAICQADQTKKRLLLPNQVDVYYPEQVRYYTAEYQQAIIEINEMISDIEGVLKDCTSKKKLKKKERIEYELLTTQLAKLDAEKNELTANMAVWASRGLPKGMVSFSQQYAKDKCYDLFTEDKIISKSEYDVEIQLAPFDSVSWYEVAKTIKVDEEYVKNVIVPDSLIWVRIKNPYGQDSIYCLRDVPGKYEKIITSPGRSICPDGYELSSNEISCLKKVTVARVIDALPIKVLKKGTRNEIYFKGFKEVPCN